MNFWITCFRYFHIFRQQQQRQQRQLHPFRSSFVCVCYHNNNNNKNGLLQLYQVRYGSEKDPGRESHVSVQVTSCLLHRLSKRFQVADSHHLKSNSLDRHFCLSISTYRDIKLFFVLFILLIFIMLINYVLKHITYLTLISNFMLMFSNFSLFLFCNLVRSNKGCRVQGTCEVFNRVGTLWEQRLRVESEQRRHQAELVDGGLNSLIFFLFLYIQYYTSCSTFEQSSHSLIYLFFSYGCRTCDQAVTRTRAIIYF